MALRGQTADVHARVRHNPFCSGHAMTQPHVPIPGAQLIHESPESCAKTIATWLVHYVANLVQRSPSEIDHQVPLSRYGVDSASAVDMTGAIEAWVGLELDPVLVYEYP